MTKAQAENNCYILAFIIKAVFDAMAAGSPALAIDINALAAGMPHPKEPTAPELAAAMTLATAVTPPQLG